MPQISKRARNARFREIVKQNARDSLPSSELPLQPTEDIALVDMRKVNTSPELSSNDKIETINPEKRTNSNDEIPLITIKRKKTKNSNDSSSAKPIPTENILLSMKNVESLLRNRPCLKCKQANLLPTITAQNGLAVNIEVRCSACDAFQMNVWTSERVEGDAKIRPFAINRRATRGALDAGLTHPAMCKLMSTLGLPFLHQTTYAKLIKVIDEQKPEQSTKDTDCCSVNGELTDGDS